MDSLMNFGLEEKGNGFDMWYYTQKQKKRKRKRFYCLDDIEKYMKRNAKKIKIHSGSWQVISIREKYL